jgi:hypothetical protein
MRTVALVPAKRNTRFANRGGMTQRIGNSSHAQNAPRRFGMIGQNRTYSVATNKTVALGVKNKNRALAFNEGERADFRRRNPQAHWDLSPSELTSS